MQDDPGYRQQARGNTFSSERFGGRLRFWDDERVFTREIWDLIKYQAARGFTLAEILIAVFIFAIVMSMLFSSFSSSLTTVDVVYEGTTNAQMAKNCINRMVSDLQSIYLNLPPAYHPPEIDTPPDLYRLVGESTNVNGTEFAKLRFTSAAHLAFGFSENSDGIAEIVYYVDQTDEGMRVLRRADQLYPYDDFEAKKTDPVLCEKIKSLAFVYYDEEGGEHETWDSESADVKYATPRAIGLVLSIGDEEASQIFKTKVALTVYRDKIE